MLILRCPRQRSAWLSAIHDSDVTYALYSTLRNFVILQYLVARIVLSVEKNSRQDWIMQTAGARQSHDILYFIFYAVQKRRSLLNMQHFTPNHACYLCNIVKYKFVLWHVLMKI